MNLKISLGVLFVFGVISMIFISGCSKNNEPGEYDALATCITASGATMYGTEWCSHCKNQKELFGDSFKLVKYVDCDRYKNDCLSAGVQGYPTWVINGTKYPGVQDLFVLADKTGCLESMDI